MFKRLLRLKDVFVEEDKKEAESLSVSHYQQRKLFGYIQYVSCDPFNTILFSEAGIRLWHDLCSTTAAYLDATGSIAKKMQPSSPSILYYPLVLRHPVEGDSPLAVAELLSSSQNVPTISNFLTLLQYHEALIFGRKNVKNPLRVETDFSMAIILAVVRAFNGERNITEYLDRCWRLVNNTSSNADRQMTNTHSCTAHVMHDIGHKLKKR